MGANCSEGVNKNKKAAVMWANICTQNYGIIPNALIIAQKITLLHFDLKFEDRLTNSKTSFVSQDVRPNGSFAVLPSPNMKYRYQCSLDQQRSQKYLPILNSSPKMKKKIN